MSYLEMFAALLGVVSVWFTAKQNILCWPIGLVMVGIYAYIFYDAKLYSDMLLQAYFFIMQIVGWIAWTRKNKDENIIQVTQLTLVQKLFWTILIIIIGLILGKIMATKTYASFPYIDAMLTSMSFVAQWLMTIKKIENWIIWIFADICYVFLYYYKELYPTSILYIIFLVIAILGHIEWRKNLNSHRILPQ
jgi:nicotinamide mononucleotide transporter